MRKFLFLIFLSYLLIFPVKAENEPGGDNNKPKRGQQDSPSPLRGNPSIPLRGAGINFTENKGQLIDMAQHLIPGILFKGAGGGYDVYLKRTGVTYVLNNLSEIMYEVGEQVEKLEKEGKLTEDNEDKTKQELLDKQVQKLNRIDVDFEGANTETQVITADKLEGYTNYYYPHCPNGITHVNSYNEVTVKNIYDNIDVKYYGGKAEGLKYDIIVNPGADPGNIKLKYSGAEELIIENARLKVKTSLGPLGEYMPRVYQNINGEIVDIKANYKLTLSPSGRVGEGLLNFELGTWNHSYPLIIDPWVTYFGGSSWENGTSVTTDASGNVLFTGNTNSTNLPVSVGAFQVASATGSDAFVVKMNSNGGLIWATYCGGTGGDSGNGVITDGASNIIVAGATTSTNFPIGFSAGNSVHQSTYGGGTFDAFLIKFNPAGLRLWSTYYGGTNWDTGSDVATDGQNVYLYGRTYSTTAISTAGVFQTAMSGTLDVYVAKFLPTGGRTWGSYVGGTAAEIPGGIICDGLSGNIYIAGYTSSTNFPAFSGHQMAYGGGVADAFLFKFSPLGARLWATYYGGTGDDMGGAVATDAFGNIILAGHTLSTNAISTVGSYQPALNAGFGRDAFLIKFNSAGVRQWGTYFGGKYEEEIGGVACDASNNIVLSGDTYSPFDLPVTSCAYQQFFLGSEDQFISSFTPKGNLICSGYLGIGLPTDPNNEVNGINSGTDGTGGCIAVDGCFVYLVATSTCTYPVTAGAFQTACGGNSDATLAKLYISTCGGIKSTLSITSTPSTFCAGQPVSFSAVAACDSTALAYSWTFPGGTPGTSSAQKPTGVVFSAPGTYPVKLVVGNNCDSVTQNIYVNACTCTFSAQANLAANVGCYDGSSGSANIVISGGSGGPYSYSWSNGISGATTGTTIPVTGFSASPSTYTLTVSEGSCKSTSTVTFTQPKQMRKMTWSVNSSSCSSPTGYAAITVGGGTPGYLYSWSNGAAAQTATGLGAGTYTLTVTDANGCTMTDVETVTSFGGPMANGISGTPVLCNGLSTGSSTINPFAGTSPYTYNWSNGATGKPATGLAAGIYTVTVKDAAGCTLVSTVTITEPGSITTTITAVAAGCGSPTGSASVAASGGTGSLTYTWSSGSTGLTASSLAVGSYTVTVRDANGCIKTDTATITGGSGGTAAASVQSNVSCNGGSNGSAVANMSGGTPSFTYSWSNGQAAQTATGLAAGIYTVKITDSNGCSSTATVSIISPPALTGQFTRGTAGCSGCGCKEWLLVTAAGGTSPYSYTWPDGYINRYKNQLCPGAYIVNIKDKNGCSINFNLTTP